jgi:hypothetical protein
MPTLKNTFRPKVFFRKTNPKLTIMFRKQKKGTFPSMFYEAVKLKSDKVII